MAVTLLLSVSCGRQEGSPHYNIVLSCRDGTWHREAARAIERERYFYDGFELKTLLSQNSDQQIADIAGLKAEEVDLLIVCPLSSETVASVIEEKFDQGIPVVLFDRKISSEKYTAYVAADNYLIGKQMGYYVESLLKDGGNVLLLRGSASVSAEQERNDGFREALLEEGLRDKIRIVSECRGNFSTSPARDAVMEALQKLPRGTRVDAVVAFNDNMAMGARQAFDSLQFQTVPPYFLGVDALPGPDGGIEQVDRGNITASFIYPQGGAEIMELAAKILRGDPYERYIPLNSTFVDKSNVKVVKIQRKQMEQQQASIDRLNGILSRSLDRYADQRERTLQVALFALLVLLAATILMVLYRMSVKSRKELNQSNQNLRELTQKLEEANQAKLSFFTNISHEFKTPLSLIVSPLESLLDEKGLSAQGKDSVHMMQRNAGRLQALINEILDFRKIESGRMQVSVQPVEVEGFLREINAFFSDIVCRKQVKFSFEVASGSYWAMIDKEKVEKIYFNILSNAVKFVEDTGEITVRLRKTGGPVGQMMEVSVFNSDSFIPESERKDIFQRFYKIDSSNNSSGTGIGLALAAALTDVLEGEIFVSSKEDVGTTFTFRLPFSPAGDMPEADVPAPVAAPESSMAGQIDSSEKDYSLLDELGNGDLPMALVIEDNADMRRYLKDILSQDYQVCLTESGEQGIQRAVQFLPKIVLCDIMMPGIKGYEVCRTLKWDVRTRDIPVILLSACSLDEQVAQGFESGADAYIMKPFSAKVLKVRMKKLIEKAEARRRDLGTDWLVGNDRSTTSTQAAFLSEIKQYIEKNLEKEITIQDLIENLGMSKSKFYRDLKEITEYSPSDIINLIRIRIALNLITTKNKNISQAAAETGFSSTSYFCRVFYKYYKESPSNWLKHNTTPIA